MFQFWSKGSQIITSLESSALPDVTSMLAWKKKNSRMELGREKGFERPRGSKPFIPHKPSLGILSTVRCWSVSPHHLLLERPDDTIWGNTKWGNQAGPPPGSGTHVWCELELWERRRAALYLSILSPLIPQEEKPINDSFWDCKYACLKCSIHQPSLCCTDVMFWLNSGQ